MVNAKCKMQSVEFKVKSEKNGSPSDSIFIAAFEDFMIDSWTNEEWKRGFSWGRIHLNGIEGGGQ
jgi:hypothetical protein